MIDKPSKAFEPTSQSLDFGLTFRGRFKIIVNNGDFIVERKTYCDENETPILKLDAFDQATL